jgi:hypothetical protein
MIRAEMAREDHDDYNRARGEVLFRIGRLEHRPAAQCAGLATDRRRSRAALPA